MNNLQAFIRLKPIGEEGEVEGVNEYEVENKRSNEKYRFSGVFGKQCTNIDVFEKIGKPLIELGFKGYNGCIFAYGQTSSGKTHTMKGDQNEKGMIPLSLQQIYLMKEQMKQQYDVGLSISYIEIYNEQILDLLSEKQQHLEIRENQLNGIHIPGLKVVKSDSIEETIKLYEKGENMRKVGVTGCNSQSSRSHTIFRMQLQVRNRMDIREGVKESTINLVDLAGSEGVSKAKTEGQRLKEGNNINKSLLALSNVILKSVCKDGFINYRDSKLTRLLQEQIGGNSCT